MFRVYFSLLFCCMLPVLPVAAIAAEDLHFELDPRFVVGDDDDTLLGQVMDVLLHSSGHLYVLDFQLEQVMMIDADGRSVRTIGRGGEGPGEFRSPTALIEESTTVFAVVQAQPPRLVRFSTAGEVLEDGFAGPGPGEGFRVLARGARAGDFLVLEEVSTVFEGGEVTNSSSLRRYDLNDESVLTLAEHSSVIAMSPTGMRIEEATVSPFNGNWTLTADGAVVFSATYGAHDLRRADLRSGDQHALTHPGYEARPRTEERLTELKDRMQEQMAASGVAMAMEFVPSPVPGVFSGVYARSDGEVWARRVPESVPGARHDGRLEDGGSRLHFDRFTADGRFVGTVTIKGPDALAEQRIWLHEDTLVWLHQPTAEEAETMPVTVGVFALRASSPR